MAPRASVYGGASAQHSGFHPSPYQNRHRLHSKHGSRGYKRRANKIDHLVENSDGSRAQPAFTDSAQRGCGGDSSTAVRTRGRGERDSFLVDINRTHRSASGATSTLLYASQEGNDSQRAGGRGSGSGSGSSTWHSNPSNKNSRLASRGPPIVAMTSQRHCGNGLAPSRTGEFTVGVSGGQELQIGVGSSRVNIPQRYTRSRERHGHADFGSEAGRNAGNVRRADRHQQHTEAPERSKTSKESGKLPSIGNCVVTREVPASGSIRIAQSKAQFFGGKELVVRTEGCATSGACTIQGHKPGNAQWENQDSYIMEEDLKGESGARLFAVLDGHGELGHLVSQRCANQLPKLMSEANLGVTNALHKTAEDLRTCNIDCTSSGATCVLATIRTGKICVANLGDSKCILARVVKDQLCAVPLSIDHKPDRDDERQRILKKGGQVIFGPLRDHLTWWRISTD